MATPAELELARELAKFYADPLGFVMFAYPWTTNPDIQMVRLLEPWASRYRSEWGPDAWACEFLEALGEEIKARRFNGRDAVVPIRMAAVSGHGIGKSAMTGWLGDFIRSTRPHSQGTVTATTGPQLETKTWPQIVKWANLSVTKRFWNITSGRGSMRIQHRSYPETWYCSAQTCREENSEAFQGQHAPNSTSYYINDESSGVPDTIAKVEEGGLSDGEPMQFAFGNGTRNTGWFRECFRKQRHRWRTWEIDSRDVQLTNKQHIQEQIDDYGIDSDFIKVRVRGMFPSASVKQYISTDLVDAAFGKHLREEQFNFAPRILTCDPAWEGDDELVIGFRQGLMFRVEHFQAKNDNDVEVANRLARLEDELHADAVFIDMGYGTGIYSAGVTMGRGHWQLVNFGGDPDEVGDLNKRASMWREMRNWLKVGGAIPKDARLYDDLIGPETVPRMDGKLQIEKKSDMKKRGLVSPNRGDALALSFAYPVLREDPTPGRQPVVDYDPMDVPWQNR